MTLSQLRVLLAVAEHGGFTPAAEQIGSSQPAVSSSIAALEAEPGTALLTRRREGVTPPTRVAARSSTPREAVRHVDSLRTEVAAITGQVTGTLRLASLPSATGTLLASPLRTFADRYPQVQVRLVEGGEQEIRDWLARGAADVGVITLPAPDLLTVVLGTHEMVAVVPADHELADRATISFAAMAGQPFILSTAGCEPLITAAVRRAGVRLDIAFEADRPGTHLARQTAAGEGFGGAVRSRPADHRSPVERGHGDQARRQFGRPSTGHLWSYRCSTLISSAVRDPAAASACSTVLRSVRPQGPEVRCRPIARPGVRRAVRSGRASPPGRPVERPRSRVRSRPTAPVDG